MKNKNMRTRLELKNPVLQTGTVHNIYVKNSAISSASLVTWKEQNLLPKPYNETLDTTLPDGNLPPEPSWSSIQPDKPKTITDITNNEMTFFMFPPRKFIVN
jgi:hypothetical protein